MSKQRSEKRFEQLRYLRDEIIPSLPKGRGKGGALYAAVVYACWAFARGREGRFDATNQQIADATNMSRRGVIGIMGKLERGGVIVTIKRGAGHFGSVRRFTFKPYAPPKDGVREKTPLECVRTQRVVRENAKSSA